MTSRQIMLLLAPVFAAFQSESPETSAEAARHVLHEQVASNKTPSVRYVFFNADSILFRHDEGLADVARGVPVSPSTSYHGFSVTKTFTALAVMQLAEAGKVDLDQPVFKYLAAFPYPHDITVRQLLTHTSGIPNPIPLAWTHLAEEHASFDGNAFFRPVWEKHSKVKSGVNQRVGYSNLGYIFLGQLIEMSSGVSYADYVSTHIIQPLGLTPAELGFAIDESTLAHGYHKGGTFSYFLLRFLIDRPKYIDQSEHRWKPFRRFYVNGQAYGGLIGTPDGFARYAQAFLGARSSLISPEGRRQLLTEHVLANGKGTGMGMAWFKGELDGRVYYAHAGGGGGYYCELRVYPELGLGSVVMFNRTGMRDERFLDRVDRHLLPISRSVP